MATKIVTKNSSTASAVPTASDLVQGELAVNVADKRLFTEDNGGSIVELGTNPSTIDINAGSIDGTAIGASSASTGAFTTLTATGIDVTGTATMDGLSSSDDITITKNSSSAPATLTLDCADPTIVADQVFGVINFEHSDSNDAGVSAKIQSVSDFNNGVARLEFFTGSPTSLTKAMQIKNNGDISFYEDTGTTAKLFWDASAESLGIGTSSPSASLHTTGDAIIGTTTHGASYEGVLQIADGAVNGRTAVLIYNNHPDQFMKLGQDANTTFIGRDNADEFAIGLFDNASDTTLDKQFVIDSSGNVGIGTSSPSTFQSYANSLVVGTGVGGEGITVYSGTLDYGALVFADGTSGNSQLRAGQVVYDHGTNSMFFNTNASEAMRIDSSGNLLVGTTSVISAGVLNTSFLGGTKNGIDLQNTNSGNSGAFIGFFNSTGSLAGAITQTGATTTNYGTSSDQRLKENIQDADDAGSKIDAIQVRQYDWKADGSHQDYGMIAQELQTVAPEAVSGDADSEEMMGVDYSKLVPMLIKEIQSLRNRVAQLEE